MTSRIQHYIEAIDALLSSRSNPDEAARMKRYMRNQFEFFGIRAPLQKQLSKQLLKKHLIDDANELRDIVTQLWDKPEREYQYVGLSILSKHLNRLQASDLELMAYVITTKPWWDTVDYIAAHLVGPILQRHPEAVETYAENWLKSGNMWLQRTVILHQLGRKRDTDERLLFRAITHCAGDTEFFIRKAIGWALREYAKTNPDAVLAFASQQPLSPLSRREALKHVRVNA